MESLSALTEALRLLRLANTALAAEVWSSSESRHRLACYVEARKLAAFGEATLAARVGDADGLARLSGSSVGRARETIDTGRAMSESPVLGEAVGRGEVSLDQASEIARTASLVPESMAELVEVARSQPFRALKDRARKVRLEAEDRDDLRSRRHRARRLRHWVGELGMVHLDAALEPQVGAPIVARLEREARRRAREARSRGIDEPVDCHLADALADGLAGSSSGSRPGRGDAEVVVLVSHGITQRGWDQVRDGEVCSIPGLGPIHPKTAREIAQDAFLSGVFYDGTDLRHLKRWTRHIPSGVRLALRLGEPPEFDGPRCVDCGRRLNLEVDHLRPFAAGGPTSLANSGLRCPDCHEVKTRADLAAIRAQRHRRRERERLTAPPARPP
jgi:hypothetical protein